MKNWISLLKVDLKLQNLLFILWILSFVLYILIGVKAFLILFAIYLLWILLSNLVWGLVFGDKKRLLLFCSYLIILGWIFYYSLGGIIGITMSFIFVLPFFLFHIFLFIWYMNYHRKFIQKIENGNLELKKSTSDLNQILDDPTEMN